jgi:hypothetical protein
MIYAIESHPNDSRFRIAENGVAQTLIAARLGRGGGATFGSCCAGFLASNSGKTRSIGYEEERSPTLFARGQIPCVIAKR